MVRPMLLPIMRFIIMIHFIDTIIDLTKLRNRTYLAVCKIIAPLISIGSLVVL